MRLRLIPAIVLVVTSSGVAAAPALGASASDRTAFAQYVSSASWPVRAASLRINTASSRISDWLAMGDPPYLGEIAGACRNVLALAGDRRGSLAQLRAPARLETPHLRLVRAYEKVRAGCAHARALTIRARDAVNTEPIDSEKTRLASARARRYVRLFLPVLQSFSHTVVGWRTAVLGYASTLGVKPPAWVAQLG
jgi:hypothetical protein